MPVLLWYPHFCGTQVEFIIYNVYESSRKTEPDTAMSIFDLERFKAQVRLQ